MRRELLVVALELAGVAAIVTGVALIYVPAAWIIAGVLVVLIAVFALEDLLGIGMRRVR